MIEVPKRILICVNPVAGQGKSKVIVDKLLGYASSKSLECVLLESSSDISILPSLLANLKLEDFRAVIAIGGDGIVHQLIQILSKTELGIFVIPTGTGNDFARSNKLLSADPAEVFNRIFAEAPKAIDLGRISHGSDIRYFGQILSTGFDALVNERANRNNLISGKMKYNIATAFELPSFRPIHYRIEVDGEVRELDAMLLAVANGPSYGGGMQLVPHADRKDGMLDIMILHPVSKIELVKVFPKVYSGKHVSHPAVEFLKVRKIVLSADSVAFADGERIASLPISIEVMPNALYTWTA